jgi:hypothetical protein
MKTRMKLTSNFTLFSGFARICDLQGYSSIERKNKATPPDSNNKNMVTTSELLVVVLSLQSATAFVQHWSSGRYKNVQHHCLQSASSVSDTSSSSSQQTVTSSWQDDADKFLNPTTPPSKRQQLLTKLIQQNSNIRASVEQAFRDGTVR